VINVPPKHRHSISHDIKATTTADHHPQKQTGKCELWRLLLSNKRQMSLMKRIFTTSWAPDLFLRLWLACHIPFHTSKIVFDTGTVFLEISYHTSISIIHTMPKYCYLNKTAGEVECHMVVCNGWGKNDQIRYYGKPSGMRDVKEKKSFAYNIIFHSNHTLMFQSLKEILLLPLPKH